MEDIDFVKEKIRWHMNEIADTMANGSYPTYESYREAVGVIKGLAMAEGFFKQAAERRNQGDADVAEGLTPVQKNV